MMGLVDPSDLRRALYDRAGALPSSGGSGYFTVPGATLDPHLFFPDSQQMLPEVRRWILVHLYNFWVHRYAHPQEWSTVWLAGSGATYQWDAVRESPGAPGDLDILIGVDYEKFFAANPRFRGFSPADLSVIFNDELRDGLGKKTADSTLPDGGRYEVTFYVNPGATDIRAINPYAAYDITHSRWTVPPIELPKAWGPHSFSDDWWAAANQLRDAAEHIRTQYALHLETARRAVEGSPAWLNGMTGVHQAVKEGAALFDVIHEGRHAAFSKDGKGYADFANFRWQASKLNGTIAITRALKRLDEAAHKDITARCHNGPILDAQHALTLAVLAQSA